MSDDLTVQATSRSVFGKGASRRLRREKLIPGIVYGANEDPEPICMPENEVWKYLQNNAFYSSLIMVSVDGKKPYRTILRDVQRHPYKQQILHMDFQRVVAGAELTITVPLHFVGEETSPGVKNEGGVPSHNMNEVAAACRPRDIPEYIEVDMSQLSIGDSIHLSDLRVPEGVRLTDLNEAGDDSDHIVASVNAPRVEVEPVDEGADLPDELSVDEAPGDEGDGEEKED